MGVSGRYRRSGRDAGGEIRRLKEQGKVRCVMGKISKIVMSCLYCILTLSLTGLCGCATTKRSNLISLGMTKVEVIKIMGTPASSKGQSNFQNIVMILFLALIEMMPLFAALGKGIKHKIDGNFWIFTTLGRES